MIDLLTKEMAASLAAVPAVEAVVLGGSRARGDAGPGSDYDLGLYFQSCSPFTIQDLQRAVLPFVDAGSGSSLTRVGEWGPWIVGGGWLTVKGQPVDILYRSLDDVQVTIDQALNGIIRVDYQPGHPHGFVSAIWLAEIHYCKPIIDKNGAIARLKQSLQPYPRALGLAILDRFQWEIAFAAGNAAKAIKRGDRTYIAGCIFRALACVGQVICALNGTYVMNEKGALRLAASQPLAPTALASRVDLIWENFASGDFEEALRILGRIGEEVDRLADSWRATAE
ncbi:nucleotidyltransferase domain-containing protein [Neorhizobium sp. IRAMC:178]|uniref:nucleotidyltransferase domain-containing protein n=1 Tax=Neorhizobium tunisiense TaxID=3144793 RepID=UPI0031F60577